MLALALYRARVGPCGHYLPDTTNPDNEYRYSAQANRCHACTAVAQQSVMYQENPHPQALLYAVTRR